jgi:hypothetical protein
MMRRARWAGLALIPGLVGCAAHTSVVPVGSGKLVPNVGLGGPIVAAFGAYVPIPYLTMGADYGLGSRVNLNGTLHLLPLAYQVAGLDAGVTWFTPAGSGKRPQLAIEPRVFAFASFKSGVSERLLAYPAAAVTATWGSARLFYLGSDLAGPLPKGDFDPEAPSFIWSPFFGFRWTVGGWFLLTELKWQGANVATHQLAVRYLRVGNNGGLTPLLAIQRRF